MANLVAYGCRVYISEDDVTYNEIDGCADVTAEDSLGQFDASSFKDVTGALQRITTLVDCKVNLSGAYATEVTGQFQVRKLNQSRVSGYVKVLWNGANGFKCAGLWNKYTGNAAADSAYKFTAGFEATALATVI